LTTIEWFVSPMRILPPSFHRVSEVCKGSRSPWQVFFPFFPLTALVFFRPDARFAPRVQGVSFFCRRGFLPCFLFPFCNPLVPSGEFYRSCQILERIKFTLAFSLTSFLRRLFSPFLSVYFLTRDASDTVRNSL